MWIPVLVEMLIFVATVSLAVFAVFPVQISLTLCEAIERKKTVRADRRSLMEKERGREGGRETRDMSSNSKPQEEEGAANLFLPLCLSHFFCSLHCFAPSM